MKRGCSNFYAHKTHTSRLVFLTTMSSPALHLKVMREKNSVTFTSATITTGFIT